MELRHLRYFVAVAEELHFRRAAERLHIAQPAVSEQIRKLEAELGVRLFARNQRSVALTPAGAALLPEARRTLTQAEAAVRSVRATAGGSLGELRVGYAPTAVPSWLPRALRGFAAAAPGLRVSFETDAARRLLERLREQRLDVVVACLPAPLAGLRATPIGDEAVVAAIPEDHPCARLDSVALTGLSSTAFVHLPRQVDPAFHDAALGAVHAAGIAPELVEVAEASAEQQLLAVAAGAGVALMLRSVARRYSVPGVRFVALEAPVLSVPVALVCNEAAGTVATSFVRIALRSVDRPGADMRLAA